MKQNMLTMYLAQASDHDLTLEIRNNKSKKLTSWFVHIEVHIQTVRYFVGKCL